MKTSKSDQNIPSPSQASSRYAFILVLVPVEVTLLMQLEAQTVKTSVRWINNATYADLCRQLWMDAVGSIMQKAAVGWIVLKSTLISFRCVEKDSLPQT